MRALSLSLGWMLAACVSCALDEAGSAAPVPDASLGGSGGGSAGGTSTGGVGASGGAAGSDGSAGAGAIGGGGDGGFSTALHLARIEVPCVMPAAPPGCTAAKTSSELTFEGPLGVVHDVTLRIRGVVELTSYAGGTPDGNFRSGGQGLGDGWGQFSISVSNPPETYFLNNGQSGTLYCHALDYSRTIPIAGGATVTLTGDPLDNLQVRNIDGANMPIVVAGVPPAPAPFDGQFIQIDVVAVTAR